MSPIDGHVLIPCEYVTLHGTKDFADVMENKELEMGRLSLTVSSFETIKVSNLFLLGQRDAIREGLDLNPLLLAFKMK